MRIILTRLHLFIILIGYHSALWATEQDWGLGAFVRHAEIPFATQSDTVTSFVPMMFYQGEHFFIKGTEGGMHFWQDSHNEINVIGRLRFFDIPAQYQNAVQGDTIDIGLQWHHQLNAQTHLDSEILSDLNGDIYGQFTAKQRYESGRWEWMPEIGARLKTSAFNSRYYALELLTNESIGAGIEFNTKLTGRYHVGSNFYLLGSIGANTLDQNAKHASATDKDWQAEAYLGFALFNDKTQTKKKHLRQSGYIRAAHGWATPSNIGEILSGNTVKDQYNNQLTSIFYGLPLTDEVLGMPLDVYLTPGFVFHHESQVQERIEEYVLGIKAYYTFSWPVRWRLGVAEGLSYVSDITYIERSEMERKGYRPSELLNYLDFTIDVNLGDVFNISQWKKTWLGYSIHHRSAIFESASQFGRIKGGSNYNTLYIQVHF
ncbi:outer membrane protein [Pseudoalteromonas ulvae UL12]|uniref:MipA/OmpV family protein n=1 Tax=Pseudoalteromonas ulvae TaxID=107327 RepID=UPI00186B9339|nr:MipA/OmpV family protein [Pseudoalteromonas ulvae]MBE0365407.1 outer membrane protein [Pseudoalteromonas ulvae UL12]